MIVDYDPLEPVVSLDDALSDRVLVHPDHGTNVAPVPSAAGFVFAYVSGSFRRHAGEAARLDLPLRVVREPRLGWDVDRPDDLRAPNWSACP